MNAHRQVALAARAIARHGLAHAYGHVSARIDGGSFLVTPPHPLGRVRLDTQMIVCPVEGDLAQGALPEVRMHQEIYRARPEVGGICRFQSPSVLALSALGRTPRALHGLGAYFAPEPPLWNSPRLVRDVARAREVATQLGPARAIVLRGNGAVTVGESVDVAACHAFFLEDAARLELSILPCADAAVRYTAEESAERGAGDRNLYARMWEFLLGEDVDAPEVSS